ncbi:hypothetical protein JNUCC64_24575 [Streptomyces sp. JNUCC 64]
MTPRRTLAGIGAALSVVAAALFGFAPPVHAGTNGQQLLVVDSTHELRSAMISGHDQNGQYTRRCVPLPHFENGPDGWWWKGRVMVEGYILHHCDGVRALTTSYSLVPQSNPGDQPWVIPLDGPQTGGNQRVVFYDNHRDVASVRLTGTNQAGQDATGCFNTPGWKTETGWWWKGYVSVTGYSGTGCSGTVRGSMNSEIGMADGTWAGTTITGSWH